MSFEPKTSKEKYLATQAGLYDGDLPAPKTNEEYYLKEMAENPSSGGCEIFYTNVVRDETLNKYVLDKNYNEIVAAFDAGKIVMSKTDMSEGDARYAMVMLLTAFQAFNGAYGVIFGETAQSETEYDSDSPSGVLVQKTE